MDSNEPESLQAKIQAELLRIEEDCNHSGKSHFNAAARWGTYQYFLGVPSVVLSAAAGTAFLKDDPRVAAAMSALAALLTALMTFLKPSERSAAHKSAGDQYLGLRNDARVFREIRLQFACDDQTAINGLDEFTKRRNELNLSCPQFANRDFQKARRGIDAGEALHQVDKSKT
jgi:hypothetical protein